MKYSSSILVLANWPHSEFTRIIQKYPGLSSGRKLLVWWTFWTTGWFFVRFSFKIKNEVLKEHTIYAWYDFSLNVFCSDNLHRCYSNLNFKVDFLLLTTAILSTTFPPSEISDMKKSPITLSSGRELPVPSKFPFTSSL